jgi:hypothetical protein
MPLEVVYAVFKKIGQTDLYLQHHAPCLISHFLMIYDREHDIAMSNRCYQVSALFRILLDNVYALPQESFYICAFTQTSLSINNG